LRRAIPVRAAERITVSRETFLARDVAGLLARSGEAMRYSAQQVQCVAEDREMLRLAMQAAALACALLMLPAGAGAQTYPSRPITLIVTFPPGASSDIVARTAKA
jgi:hypothetical protein